MKGEDGGDDELTTRHNMAWQVNIDGRTHKIRDDGKQQINKEGKDLYLEFNGFLCLFHFIYVVCMLTLQRSRLLFLLSSKFKLQTKLKIFIFSFFKAQVP